MLKPREDQLLEENWTDKENEAVDQHFAYLEKLKELGILILAGKTKGMDEKTFGIMNILCPKAIKHTAKPSQYKFQNLMKLKSGGTKERNTNLLTRFQLTRLLNEVTIWM